MIMSAKIHDDWTTTMFDNIGWMGRKLETWMHVQLWPVGGARADELATFTKSFYGLP